MDPPRDQDQFDGSLYYIVSGRVQVHFHEFVARATEGSEPNHTIAGSNNFLPGFRQDQAAEAVKVSHDEGTVVTSLLSMMEGMVSFVICR